MDYSKPPPGYEVGPDPSSDANGQWFWTRGPEGGEGNRGDVALDGAAALTVAWVHYKEHNDPPGIKVECGPSGFTGGCPDGAWWEEMPAARAAAWAWHDVRLTLAARLAAAAGVVVEHFHDDVAPRRTPVPNDRLAAYLAREDVLGDADYADGVATELMDRGVMRFEGDPPIERVSLDAWPRCLTWSNDQVAEVERWLLDSTAEMPKVLRG